MNAYSILGVSLCLILGSGCRTLPNPVVVAPQSQSATAASGSLEAEFRTGKALLENGNHMAAIKQFAYLRDHADSAEQRDRAVVGLSMALQDSGNSAAALGVLEPLPLLPSTRLDAMKCVLAGELYLHQQNFEFARTWLIRGLEVEAESRKSYRAAALFNLGKALLAEDDLEDAYIAFGEAQEVFIHNRDEASAQQCQLIVADINRALQ